MKGSVKLRHNRAWGGPRGKNGMPSEVHLPTALGGVVTLVACLEKGFIDRKQAEAAYKW